EQSGRPITGIKIVCGSMINNKIMTSVSNFDGIPVNENGEFVIDKAVAGHYGVQVVTDSANYYSDILTFDVKNQNVKDLKLTARQALSIRGTVVLYDNNDAAVKAQLSTLTLGAYVYPLNAVRAMNNSTAIVGPDGDFLLNSLVPGNVRFVLDRG